MRYSNVTPKEHYRIYGTLETSHIEELLAAVNETVSLQDVAPNLHEARAQYPEEGFLADVTHRLKCLSKNMRGDNKDEAKDLIEELERIEQEQVNAGEYGREELREALTAIGGD